MLLLLVFVQDPVETFFWTVMVNFTGRALRLNSPVRICQRDNVPLEPSKLLLEKQIDGFPFTYLINSTIHVLNIPMKLHRANADQFQR